jgi:Histidine phosphatase superfamily (branch 1)
MWVATHDRHGGWRPDATNNRDIDDENNSNPPWPCRRNQPRAIPRPYRAASTELGRAQAKAVATRIAKTWNAAKVYTSPMGRCVATGREIASACGVASEPMEALNDLDYGQWQWRTYDEVQAAWPELFRNQASGFPSRRIDRAEIETEADVPEEMSNPVTEVIGVRKGGRLAQPPDVGQCIPAEKSAERNEPQDCCRSARQIFSGCNSSRRTETGG